MIVKAVSMQNYLEFWENLTHPLVVAKITQKTLIKLQLKRKARSIFELFLESWGVYKYKFCCCT